MTPSYRWRRRRSCCKARPRSWSTTTRRVTLSAPEAVASLKTSLATAYLARRDRPHADESLQAAFQAVPDYARR